MAKQLPEDFREFLKLCNRKRLRYLVIGGYAVGYYGYPRATGDLDVWIERSEKNISKVVAVWRAFGFDTPELGPELFREKGRIFRVGMPPIRLEILNDISGVEFAKCYASRHRARIDGIRVDLINLGHLKKNKKAAGRPKDLDDLEHL